MAQKRPLLVSCNLLRTHDTVFETNVTTKSCHDSATLFVEHWYLMPQIATNKILEIHEQAIVVVHFFYVFP